MVRKKEDKVLTELFKDTLDGVEITPSSSFEKKLMRKVRTKEFFDFYPQKMNIWYVGLAAAIAVAAVLIFIPGNKNDITRESSPVETVAPVPAIDNETNRPANDTLLNEVSDEAITAEPGANKVVVNEAIVEKVGGETPSSSLQVTDSNINSGSISQLAETKASDNHDDTINDVNNEANSSDTKVGQLTEQSVRETNLSNSQVVSKELINQRDVTRSVEEPLFVASVYDGCTPLKVSFLLTDTTSREIRWSFGDGGYSSVKAPEWIFDEEGVFTVELKIIDGGKVVDSYSSNITVYPNPVARFETSPENVIIPDDHVTFLNYSTGAVEYQWSFGDGFTSGLFEPVHSYLKFGNYDVSLTAISEYGCVDSLLVKNAFATSAYFINFPNAFVPNPAGQSGGYYVDGGPEADRVFHPVASGVVSYQLKIFSRAGVLLFESNNLDIGWDGYYKSRLCDAGVYVWKVRGTYQNGEQFTKVGDITIFKSEE